MSVTVNDSSTAASKAPDGTRFNSETTTNLNGSPVSPSEEVTRVVLAKRSSAGVVVDITDVATETTLAAVNTKLGAALALPTGAATSAKQDTLATAVGLQAKLTDTQPVSAASLPLPSGAATDSGLASIFAKLSSDPATQTTLAAILAKLVSTPALEGGNLATIAGKDFATQATLALIKAKTDNLDVALSTVAKDGTDITTPTAMPAGGVGIRGWLSAIWTKLNGTLTVSGTVTANAGTGTLAVSVASAPALIASSAIIGKVGIDQTTPGTTNLVALAANQSVNQAQIAGAATSVNSGNKDAGTQRVVIATDQPAFAVTASPGASELHTGEVGGKTVSVAVTIARPADTNAYAALDAVTTSTGTGTIITFAGASRLASGSGYITKAMLKTDQAACVAQCRLWLYNVINPNIPNDNAAHLIKWADRASLIGYIDFPALSTEAGSDVAQAFNDNIRIGYVADASSAIYGELQTRTAFTPASAQNFHFLLNFEQN